MCILVLLALILVSSADEGVPAPACVTSFTAFEKAVIDDHHNAEALAKAFYEANSLFSLSVQIVYRVISSNGTEIISTNSDCPPKEEFWLWVPSPVFIFLEPTKLNIYALYMLNFFIRLGASAVNISVPNTCSTVLVNDFTMQVSVAV